MNSAASSETKLQIRYSAPDGTPAVLALADKPITIGRSPDADIITLDERASRMHCGVRLWDGEYYVKDLKSKNGTYLNSSRVEMAKIKPGDKIRIGNSVLNVEDVNLPGTATSLNSVQDEMNEGKGYNTILHEIVNGTDERPTENAKDTGKVGSEVTAVDEDAEGVSDADRPKTAKLAVPEKDGGPTASKLTRSKRPASIKIKRK